MLRILLLGGTGFIGYNLERFLSQKKIKITVASRNPKGNARNRIRLDILNFKHLKKIVKNFDIIINLVGESGATTTLKKPQTTIEVNTIGHLNLLEACRLANPNAKIIFISSRLEYGIPEKLPVSSTDLLHPNTIYGISKYIATKYSLIYNRIFGLKTIVLRLSNPFGPQLFPAKDSYNIVNYFILTALKGMSITIFGKGNQKRDYIYIEDVCSAIWTLMFSKKAEGRVINIGGSKPTSLKTMADIIVKTAGTGKIIYTPWPKEWKRVETGDFFFNIMEAKKLIHWSPKTSVKNGILQTKSFLLKRYKL